MINMIWKVIATIVSNPRITEWLIARAQATPYYHLDGYMNRWWLWNAHSPQIRSARDVGHEKDPRNWFMRWLPSIRIHHILREDHGRHDHDHPWHARTIILKGWYWEVRNGVEYMRCAGDTATLRFGEYHTIVKVSPGGVWTLFLCGKWRGVWGFNVNGVKVPWREYLGVK